jgi:pseudouridine kinase
VIVCIGGANVDRKYACVAEAQRGTSNPAYARRSFGGVARNVAETLARLNVAASLFTVLGADESGAALLSHARDSGIDTRLTIQSGAHVTGEYAAVLDPRGELVIGAADMSAIESLSVEDFDAAWSAIQNAEWIFIDCNVSASVLQHCIARAGDAGTRLAIDAVSTAKVRKLPGDLTGVDLLFLNEAEAAAYLASDLDAVDAVQALRGRGCGGVILTRGARGLVVADERIAELPASSADCNDVTGAGDALIACTLYRLLQGDDLTAAARTGMLGAAKTLETAETVRADISQWIVS